MSEETVRAIVLALLGTGGATFVWTVVKSFIAWRNSAEGREDKAVARLEQFEKDCREQLQSEREWGSYWQRRSGQAEYLLDRAGVKFNPPTQPPHND